MKINHHCEGSCFIVIELAPAPLLYECSDVLGPSCLDHQTEDLVTFSLWTKSHSD